MVKRQENTGLAEFTGVVKSVQQEQGLDEDRKQYHITIEPEGIEIKGATGLLHEWYPLSPKCEENSVPEGSVMDRMLTQIEICISESKKAETIKEAFNLLIGKKFKFKKIKLGKEFEGHAAKEYIVPVAAL